MPNQSWIKIRRDNGKEDYAPVSRSKHYPEQGTKQLSRKTVQSSEELHPGVYSVSPGPTLDQLHATPDNATDPT